MPRRKRTAEAMEDGARKRARVAAAHPAQSYSPPSKSQSRSAMAGADGEASSSTLTDCAHLKTLQVMQNDFDSLRSLITCKICERLLYEPYVLSCGHTYCYSCLSTWFVANKKKTCPNCRDVITQVPAPSYVIKEMTLVFVSRAELLPDGETVDMHAQWQKEEADLVLKDKENTDPHRGGLFNGCFHRRVRLEAVHDPGDGVDRCPQCHWELEDGMCQQCGLHLDQDTWFSDDDADSMASLSGSDLDAELDAELDADLAADLDADFDGRDVLVPGDSELRPLPDGPWGPRWNEFANEDSPSPDAARIRRMRSLPRSMHHERISPDDGLASEDEDEDEVDDQYGDDPFLAPRRHTLTEVPWDPYTDEEDYDEDDDEDNEDPTMQGFIDDEEVAAPGSDSDSEIDIARAHLAAHERASSSRRQAVARHFRPPVRSAINPLSDSLSPSDSSISSDSDDSVEQEVYRVLNTRPSRRSRPVVISSSDDDDDDDDNDDDRDHAEESVIEEANGFSPAQSSIHEEDSESDTESENGAVNRWWDSRTAGRRHAPDAQTATSSTSARQPRSRARLTSLAQGSRNSSSTGSDAHGVGITSRSNSSSATLSSSTRIPPRQPSHQSAQITAFAKHGRGSLEDTVVPAVGDAGRRTATSRSGSRS